MPTLEATAKSSVTVAPSRPVIGLGPCLWRSQPGATPYVALVTSPGSVIQCVVFAPDAKWGEPKDTVRHSSDPEFARFSHLGSGVWDYPE